MEDEICLIPAVALREQRDTHSYLSAVCDLGPVIHKTEPGHHLAPGYLLANDPSLYSLAGVLPFKNQFIRYFSMKHTELSLGQYIHSGYTKRCWQNRTYLYILPVIVIDNQSMPNKKICMCVDKCLNTMVQSLILPYRRVT